MAHNHRPSAEYFAYSVFPNAPARHIQYHSPTSENQIITRIPRTFMTLKDRNRKDIVIDETGATKNVMQVTERILPNGSPYRTINVGVAETDVLQFMETMDSGMRVDFVSKNWVEVVIKLDSQETEEQIIAEDKRREEELFRFGAAGTACSSPNVRKPLPELVKVLRSLPGYFYAAASKVVVTLEFPAHAMPMVPTGSRAESQSVLDPTRFLRGNSSHTVCKCTEYQLRPNFTYAALVASEINRFTGIASLDIVLALPANTPITPSQLHCVLPFYDLDFIFWTASWKTGIMSKPELLQGWPLRFLNYKRNSILGERANGDCNARRFWKDLSSSQIIDHITAYLAISTKNFHFNRGS